jgi:hypothetical protein
MASGSKAARANFEKVFIVVIQYFSGGGPGIVG